MSSDNPMEAIPGRSGSDQTAGGPARRPEDAEIDVYGLTHPGLVRDKNQDHFLIGSIRRQLHVVATSLPLPINQTPNGERLAFVAMVADGVGGGRGGEVASRMAIEEIGAYIAECTDAFHRADPQGAEFIDVLEKAALDTHTKLQAASQADPERRGMATTLTLWLGVWPWIYVLQVGDSRYYLYRDGNLCQISRDQTMAQDLIDQGILPPNQAASSRWSNVLFSSIGGSQALPVVTRLPGTWDSVHLICSDGLTRHVDNEQIARRLRTMTSAKSACENLLEDAIRGGGSDNITIIVGRSVPLTAL